MIAGKVSTCIVTNRVAESREFYGRHFDATVAFDCGWYVNLRFGKEHSELQFMAPKQPGQPVSDGTGIMYNRFRPVNGYARVPPRFDNHHSLAANDEFLLRDEEVVVRVSRLGEPHNTFPAADEDLPAVPFDREAAVFRQANHHDALP